MTSLTIQLSKLISEREKRCNRYGAPQSGPQDLLVSCRKWHIFKNHNDAAEMMPCPPSEWHFMARPIMTDVFHIPTILSYPISNASNSQSVFWRKAKFY